MNEVHAIFHNPKEQEISVQKKLNFAKFQEKKNQAISSHLVHISAHHKQHILRNI